MKDREAKRLQLHREEIAKGVARLLKYGVPVRPGNQDKSLNPSLADIQRRKELTGKIQRILAKLQPANDRLNLPEAKRPTIEDVIRQNLLGLVDDDTLITDIIPQSDVKPGRISTRDDPLWGTVFPLLTSFENLRVIGIFSVFKKFYFYINADKVNGQTSINTLMRESLEPGKDATFQTVGDLRRISFRGWNRIPGIGIPTANFMFEIFKKIEIPGE